MADLPELKEASKKLYAECLRVARGDKDGFRKVFHQDELQQLGELDPTELLDAIHDLSDRALFISLKQQGKVCWATRPRDAALQVCKLNKEERMVYQVIEESHQDGVWIKKIKQKLGIFDNSVEKMVNRFMTVNLIKCIRHVKAPLQKTYMLSHLAPSDEVTGGSFYDQGDLDETLVEELGNVIVLRVRSLSWIEWKRKHIKKEPIVEINNNNEDDYLQAPGSTDGRGKMRKRKRDADLPSSRKYADTDLGEPPRKQRYLKTASDLEPEGSHLQFAFPVGHRYPTTEDIRSYIDQLGLLRGMSTQTLTVDEVQQIINVLIWDEKLERIDGGYRTVRGVREKFPQGWTEESVDNVERKRGNGFTEAPCGRCPVIDLCGKSGQISAENCEQFDKWLKMF